MVDQNSQFYAILTNVGAAKQANADALGIAWKITQMGVGDANGTDPTPSANQTKLLNEWRRAPLNQLKVDDKNSAIIIAEQVIPADVGGRWIREIALYDADGDMIAVANCAPTFKPLLSQGSGRTQIVRMNLVVSSASNVQLKIDPSVVLATREWVTEELARQDFKHSVLAATTAAITLSGLQGIDGVALPAGARVLVKNQAAAKDNGLYLAASGAWTRCSDADSSTKVTPGLLVHVEQGSVNGDSAWQLVTDGLISVGVTALAFEMAYGRSGVAAGTYRSVTVDKYGRVVAASNPTTVAGYGLTDVYTKAQVDASLALKADLASPILSGAPKAPTAAIASNDTSIATTQFTQQLLGSLGWGSVGVSGSNLPAGSNLNSMTTPGSYGQTANANATLALNYPEAVAGTLLVQCASPAICSQLYTTYNSGRVYSRSCYSNVWSAWAELSITDSPALRGAPTAPTAVKGTNTQQLATTAFVQGAIAGLVDSAPGTLDTLKELAASLANDPNFATTMTNALAGKQPLDATLTALAGLSSAADQLIYSTAADTFAMAPLSAFSRTLLDDANAQAARTTLGAAPTTHTHAISEVVGLAAAVNAASGLAQGATNQDPNLAVNQVILSNHANTPDPVWYWHITTTFYSTIASTSNRSQLAIQYSGGSAVYARSQYNNQWTAWARLDNGVPPGSIIHVAGNTPPVGYIKANGAAVGRVLYAGLFAQIGTTFGAGDGSTTFNLPDLRGEFIRGVDDGRGLDAGRVLGSVQAGQNLSHTHTGSTAAAGAHTHAISGTALAAGEHSHTAPRAQNNNVGGGSPNFTTANLQNGTTAATNPAGAHTHTISGTAASAGDHSHVVTIGASGGNEARPRNIALLACIKY